MLFSAPPPACSMAPAARSNLSAANHSPSTMIAHDRRMRVARVALFLFGVPCAASLAGLQLQSSLAQVLPLRIETISLTAVTTGIGLLATMLTAWMADRWVVRRQERKLVELSTEIALARRELESEETRYAMELKLKDQELETERARREEHEETQ